MKQITLIGLGLIGGSIASALKQNNFAGQIVAYDLAYESLQYALKMSIIDKAATNIASAVQQADCIWITTPLEAYASLFENIHPHLKPGAIITDVGSVKVSCIHTAQQYLATAYSRFVPGHPLAGKEKSGIKAADAKLFQKKLIFLTPVSETEQQAIALIKALWEKIGATIEIIDAAQHDEIMAATSHLPQLLVYTYLQTLRKNSHFPELLKYTGTGFKDFSRLAASNPQLWTDIALNNQEALLQEIQQFQQQLAQLRAALASKNAKLLTAFFNDAKQAHEHYSIMHENN